MSGRPLCPRDSSFFATLPEISIPRTVPVFCCIQSGVEVGRRGSCDSGTVIKSAVEFSAHDCVVQLYVSAKVDFRSIR